MTRRALAILAALVLSFAAGATPVAARGGVTAGEVVTSTRVAGIASYYDDGPGLYAALPGWNGVRIRVTVCAARCVLVQVSDFCQCYVGTRDERVIDLSPAAFRATGTVQSRGLVPVTYEVAQ